MIKYNCSPYVLCFHILLCLVRMVKTSIMPRYVDRAIHYKNVQK